MFPCTFFKVMMVLLLMLMLLLTFDMFQLIENRVCWGVSGKVCCDGFVLNQTTGLCQKCMIGYYRDNCSEKCSPPNYGEDCQSVCQCPETDCHFVTGCFQNTGTLTYHWQLSSRREIFDGHNTSVTFTVSNVTSLYQTFDQDFSLDVDKHEESTLIYLPTDIDLFKNSFVIDLVQAVVSLVGVFVFFFAACVVTYIYFKCFRLTTDGKKLKSNQCESEYKSLSFEAVEYESQSPQEPEQQANLELNYLTPVFRNDEKSETNLLTECEITANIQMHNRQICPQLRDESQMTSDNLKDHVYIEILEHNIERSGEHESRDGENL